MELQGLQEEFQRLVKELRERADQEAAEVKRYGEATAETRAVLDRVNARLSDLETKMQRLPLHAPGDAAVPSGSEAKAAFFKWARGLPLSPEDRKHLVPVEAKALSLSDLTAAGYLAPPEFVREILKGVVLFSPIREVARVRTGAAKELQIPKRTGTFAAAWVAEGASRSETAGLSYGLETIPAHEMYGLVDVTFAMLEDSAFDLEAELREEFAEQFGKAEGAAFVAGTAVNQPEGILTNAAVAYTPSGSASAITADGLIDLFFALPDAYAKNAYWVLRRSTLGEIRKLKASGTGEYLWAPGEFGDAVRPTILGRPYIEAPDMPAVAAGAYPVVFGDLRSAYTIYDRLEIAVVRDPFTQAASGKVRFHARRRVGGQVVIAEAVRKLKIATS